jgi:hypothetical protein
MLRSAEYAKEQCWQRDVHSGPEPPEGLENNWIPTAGKRPLPTVRFYGGTEEFWNKSWEMPDVELVD